MTYLSQAQTSETRGVRGTELQSLYATGKSADSHDTLLRILLSLPTPEWAFQMFGFMLGKFNLTNSERSMHTYGHCRAMCHCSELETTQVQSVGKETVFIDTQRNVTRLQEKMRSCSATTQRESEGGMFSEGSQMEKDKY